MKIEKHYKRCSVCQKILTMNDGGFDECEFCRLLLNKKADGKNHRPQCKTLKFLAS